MSTALSASLVPGLSFRLDELPDHAGVAQVRQLILARRLPRRAYAAHLAVQVIARRALEPALERSPHPRVAELLSPAQFRLEALEADLAAVGVGVGRACGPSWCAAMELGEAVRYFSNERPVALAGSLLALERWHGRSGGFRPRLVRALDLGPDGVLSYRDRDPGIAWNELLDRAELAIPEGEHADRLVRRARRVHQLLGRAFREVGRMATDGFAV